MKKISTFLLLLLLFVTMQIGVSAETPITVAIDGQRINFEVQPTIINGSTMVPLRAIFEALGATVEWNDATKTVTSVKNSTTIKLTIGSKTMSVNGNQISLNESATIIDGFTLVPVRAISEAFGCQVGWDGNSKLVSVINDASKYTMLYAQGGRSKAFANAGVDSQLSVGWYRDSKLTDNTTDLQIYNKLKARAEASAYSCAETAVRNLHKNPDSVRVLDREIVDYDNYLRFIVKIQATGMNAAGGYVTDDYYIMLRVHPKLDGKFTYYTGGLLGYKYSYPDTEKKEFDWGVRPSDFGLAVLPSTPELVTIKQIIAFPEKYEGKYVEIKEDFKVGINFIKDKYFYSYPLDKDGYSMTSASIDIYYTYAENMEECVMSDDDVHFRVKGYVKTFSNSTEAYIDASIIEFK